MAEDKLLKKKQIAYGKKDMLAVANACNELAEYYLKANKYKSCLMEYKEEAKIYQDKGLLISYATANRMIGETYVEMGEFDKALKYHKIYLEVARKEKDKTEEQRALATIGRVYLIRGSNDSGEPDRHSLQLAEGAFKKSLLLCEQYEFLRNSKANRI